MAEIPVYHRGQYGCGGIAVYLTVQPTAGMKLHVSHIRTIVGRQPVDGEWIEPMCCAACSRLFNPFDFLRDWELWIEEPKADGQL